jgi:hypothetical protein
MSAQLEKLLLQLVSQLGASAKSKDSRKRCREQEEDSDEPRPQKRSKSNPQQCCTKSNLNDVLTALLKEDLVLMYNEIVTDGYVSKKNKDQLVREIAACITSTKKLKRGLSALYKDNLVQCVEVIGESWSKMSKTDAISYLVDYCK